MTDPLDFKSSLDASINYLRDDIKEIMQTKNEEAKLDHTGNAKVVTAIKHRKKAKFLPNRELTRTFISSIAWFGNNPNSDLMKRFGL